MCISALIKVTAEREQKHIMKLIDYHHTIQPLRLEHQPLSDTNSLFLFSKHVPHVHVSYILFALSLYSCMPFFLVIHVFVGKI